MFSWDGLTEIYRWLSKPCPRFVDGVIAGAAFLLIFCGIFAMMWVAGAVFGWHLLTIGVVSLVTVIIIWLSFTHSSLPGGVKQWWSERPWKE